MGSIKIASFLITIALQMTSFRKLGEKSWKAIIPIYKHYSFGKTLEHPIAGMVWGALAFISDFIVAFLMAEVVESMITAAKALDIQTLINNSQLALFSISYLVLHIFMALARYIVFGTVGKKLMVNRLMVLIWALLPFIGYAAISFQNKVRIGDVA